MHISPNFSKTLLLLSICIIPLVSSAADQTQTQPNTTSVNCLSNGFYDCECEKTCLIWRPQDSISIYIIGGLALSICLSFLIAYAWEKNLRRKPNSLVMVLALASITYSVNLLIQITLRIPVEQRNAHTCQFESYVSGISSITIDVYILMLLLHSLVTLKGDPQKKPSSAFLFHVLGMALISLVVYEMKRSEGFGKTMYRFCGMRPLTNLIVPFAYYGALLFLSFIMILMSSQSKRKIQKINRSKKALLKMYLPLSQLILVVFVLQALNEILLAFYTREYIHHTKDATGINITTLAKDLSKNFLPIIFVIACWRGRRSKKEKEVSSSYDTKYESLLDPTYTSMNDTDSSRVYEEESSASRAEKRIQILYSLMAGYQLTVNSCERKEADDNISINMSRESDYKVVVTDETVRKKAPMIYQEVQARRNKFMDVEMKSYSTDIFESLLYDKDLREELKESLAFSANHSRVLEYAHRLEDSGLEFFTTRDNRFYFKIISELEKNAFLHALPKYFEYLSATPESLLMKVYGIYKVKIIGTDEVYDLALVKRVYEDSEMIARRYELQGTTLSARKNDHSLEDRNGFVDTMKIEGVLKDVQFDRVERKLRMYPETAKRLCDIIYSDIQFLYSVKLRGYHVALYVIDDTYSTRDLPLSMIQEIDEEKEASSRNISVIRRAELELMSRNSSQESKDKMVAGKKIDYGRFDSITEGMYYKIGVVDFFHVSIPKRNSGLRGAMDKPMSSSTMPLSDKDFGERLVKYIRKISSQ